MKRTTLSDDGYQLIEEGKLTFKDNFSEVLTFDYPPVLPMEYIDKFFENMGSNMSKWADLPFYVDEDGEEGMEQESRKDIHISLFNLFQISNSFHNPRTYWSIVLKLKENEEYTIDIFSSVILCLHIGSRRR